MKEEISVEKATSDCEFERGRDPAGKAVLCRHGGTVKIGGVNLCDKHAEYKMTAACGRDTKIERVTARIDNVLGVDWHRDDTAATMPVQRLSS